MGVVGGCVYNRENLLVNSDVAITHTTPVRTYTCIYHLSLPYSLGYSNDYTYTYTTNASMFT